MSNINLEPLTEKYLEWARALHNDESVLKFLSDPHIVSREEQIVWYNNICNSKVSKRYIAFITENIPIGLVRIDYIDIFNHSVCVGLDIHKNFRGMGLSKEIYKLILNDMFNGNSFNRVWLTVASYNIIAVRLYEKLGFKKEGVLRKSLFKDDCYYDSFIMSILKEEWSGAKNNI
jgi:RimJ/RimL family protein N-acetyltransferase